MARVDRFQFGSTYLSTVFVNTLSGSKVLEVLSNKLE